MCQCDVFSQGVRVGCLFGDLICPCRALKC